MDLILKAIVLGIVEGITEFLPISSTGHLIILNRFIDFTGSFADMFDVVIQLGAILSVVVYFWKRLYPFSAQTAEQRGEIWDTWKKAIVGVLPAIVIGGLFGHKVEELLFNPLTVASSLLVGGVVLIVIERRKTSNAITSVAGLSYNAVLAIGLIQCLAMIPGTSRSAATIIGAMLLGASRPVAAEFSFFLAIPTMTAACAYSLYKHGANVSGPEWTAVAVGFIVSFFVAWGVIAVFMKYIRSHDLRPFGYYRVALALCVLAFLATGVL